MDDTLQRNAHAYSSLCIAIRAFLTASEEIRRAVFFLCLADCTVTRKGDSSIVFRVNRMGERRFNMKKFLLLAIVGGILETLSLKNIVASKSKRTF